MSGIKATGRVLDLKKRIEARGSLYQSDKCLMVMRSMFEHAIDDGWQATTVSVR